MTNSSPLHLLLLLTTPITAIAYYGYYANVTLSSLGGDLTATVFLPAGIKPSEATFYMASRFEHGSMIGSITRTTREVSLSKNGREPEILTKKHVLYGTDLWRVPHDPYWPESGVGLASEFGVGDDGALCLYRCGWHGVDDVTNGLLGYQEAKNGESFLKIGVGELIKGSCQACDSTDDYKFNSPYQFARQPVWTMSQIAPQTVVLEHEATLNNYGYRLRKDISLLDNLLLVRSTLTNLGNAPFSTVWYSHHFFSCDGIPIGPEYSADLGLKPTGSKMYEEPGALLWSSPLSNYASVSSNLNFVHVKMNQNVEDGIRIKTEFLNDGQSTGAFTLNACETSIHEIIAELSAGRLSAYGFNFFAEKGTFSPEPQYLIHLEPGTSTSWTQRLQFEDLYDPSTLSMLGTAQLPPVTSEPPRPKQSLIGLALLVVFVFCFIALFRKLRPQHRNRYVPIPDNQ